MIYWNLKDIKEFVGCGTNVASQIRQLAISKYEGKCFFDNRKVKKESVLKAIKELEERG